MRCSLLVVFSGCVGGTCENGCAEPVRFPYSEGFRDCGRPFKCRRERQLSPEASAHIKTLYVTDEYFYDVFSEAEIFSLFPSPPDYHPVVPFTFWGDAVIDLKQCMLDADSENHFLRATVNMYNQLRYDPWRVFDDSRQAEVCLEHPRDFILSAADEYLGRRPVIYIPLNLNGYTCTRKQQKNAACLAHAMVADKAFSEHNAANFLNILPNYRYQIGNYMLSLQRLKGEPWSDFDEFLYSRLPVSFNANNFDISPCRAYSPFTGGSAQDLPPHYPDGKLESYLFPEGMYQQVLNNRARSIWFEGQADQREAYRTRVRAVSSLKDFMPPNYLIALSPAFRASFRPDPIDDGSETPKRILKELKEGSALPTCTDKFDEPCLRPQALRKGFMDRLLNSRYGLHLRGDELNSARLIDLGMTQTIPVIIMNEAAQISLPFPCYIPWQRMAILVNEKEFLRDPMAALKAKIDKLTHDDHEKMLRLMYYYRQDFVDTLPGSRVYRNTLRDAVMNCLTPTVAHELNVSKTHFKCPFEDTHSMKTQMPQDTDADTPISPFHKDSLDNPPLEMKVEGSKALRLAPLVGIRAFGIQ